VFDVQKHYWGATIIARGFRALYMVSHGRAGWMCEAQPVTLVMRGFHDLGYGMLYNTERSHVILASHPSAHAVQDSDAIVLQDPLPFFRPDYDVQSISDWSGSSPELPRVGDTLTASCQLYKWIPDGRTPTGGWTMGWTAHRA